MEVAALMRRGCEGDVKEKEDSKAVSEMVKFFNWILHTYFTLDIFCWTR